MSAIEGEEGEMAIEAETETMGESDDAAAAVAAHGAETTVAVVVFHDEVVGFVGFIKGHEAISADAETAVTDVCDLFLGEARVVVADVDEDKVVAGAVVFEEI